MFFLVLEGKSNTGDFQVCLWTAFILSVIQTRAAEQTVLHVCNTSACVWKIFFTVHSLTHNLITFLTNVWMCIVPYLWHFIHLHTWHMNVIVSISIRKTLKPFGVIYFLIFRFYRWINVHVYWPYLTLINQTTKRLDAPLLSVCSRLHDVIQKQKSVSH